jgi:hypothetical protein
MVKLYREENSSKADRIAAEFHDIILGYDREIVSLEEASRRFGSEHYLPIITNNEKIVSGDAIRAYVEGLRTLMRDWCYVNDMGDVC